MLRTSPLLNPGTAGYENGLRDFNSDRASTISSCDIGAFENDNLMFKSAFEVLL